MFIKHTVGIDVAQKELVVCLIGLTPQFTCEVIGRKKFVNSKAGIQALFKWVMSLAPDGTLPEFVMEATGVYHVALANYLHDKAAFCGVVLPNKISNYMRTMVLKTINDDTSSEVIAQYGARHQVTPWIKPEVDLLELRDLMRERQALVEQRTTAKNQKHAAGVVKSKGSSIIQRLAAQIELFDQQIEQIEQEARQLVALNGSLKLKFKNLTSIPGVGLITAYTIVGETLGFYMVKSSRQLVSYAGLDVRTKESGTSVKAKTRISKKGNKHIRRALYFPGFSAAKHNRSMGELYNRLISKQGIPMKAAVAVQRKLLVLIYTLWKNDQPFDPTYELNRTNKSGTHC